MRGTQETRLRDRISDRVRENERMMSDILLAAKASMAQDGRL